MNRDWMYIDNRTQAEFLDGVEKFCRIALEHQRTTRAETIFCPCRDCSNVRKWKDIREIENHLFRPGFMANYTTWYWHGENINPTGQPLINNTELENREQCENNEGDSHENVEDHMDEMMDNLGNHVNGESRMFDNVSKAAETPLYPGCVKYSKLLGVLTLFNLKANHGWTDISFTSLLETLFDMFPEGNDIPKSTYYAKKLLCPLGLEYTKIDACPNDCVLFRKDYENLDACPKCDASRYKREGSNLNRKKWPSAKVIWYLPIIPRFKRLFSINKDAKNLVWHAKERKIDGYIRHPADSKQWKHIDETFPEFGKEARNLRLVLSTDGMNPYGTLSSQHSTWPVLLSIYSLPPWLYMKRKYIMLSLLISGPKQLGNDIDVFLAPLIEDLQLLWDKGVPMFDAHTVTNFTLRAMSFCTVSDFPAYGNLSGYKIKGKKACPICEDETTPTRLKNYGKDVYMHTRQLLRRDHPYRKNKAEFNGFTEQREMREPLSGIELWDKIKNVETIYGKRGNSSNKKGGLWKKVFVFWTLPYWKHLSVRHCLDVMHIEKNVCDSIIGTLLNMPNKTKDGKHVRRDMQLANIQPKLWPEDNDETKKTYLPRACYTLSRDEKRIFCECLYSIKVPTGYSSNIKRLVSMTDKRLIGMKSHDCHVMMQVMLPIALRGLLPKHVRHTIIKLCLFFNTICSKVIDPKKLDDMQADVVETLCKFEMYFPPSFFDIMVHLTVYLVREIKECGPVFLRWMYPYERQNGTLKDKATNKAQPEGSIIRGTMAEEAGNFCAVFLAKAKEIGVPISRHESRLKGQGTLNRQLVKPPFDKLKKAHLYLCSPKPFNS